MIARPRLWLDWWPQLSHLSLKCQVWPPRLPGAGELTQELVWACPRQSLTWKKKKNGDRSRRKEPSWGSLFLAENLNADNPMPVYAQPMKSCLLGGFMSSRSNILLMLVVVGLAHSADVLARSGHWNLDAATEKAGFKWQSNRYIRVLNSKILEHF